MSALRTEQQIREHLAMIESDQARIADQSRRRTAQQIIVEGFDYEENRAAIKTLRWVLGEKDE